MGAAWSMNSQGDVYRDQGLYPAAAASYGQCLQLFRELGDPWGIAATLGDLGSLATKERAYDTASSLYRESIAIFRQLERLCFTKLGDSTSFPFRQAWIVEYLERSTHKELARHSFS